MAFRSSFVATSIAVLSALTVGCNGTTTCDCGPTQANPLDADSQEIVTAVNATRTAAGLSTVTACKSLNVSAAAHADQMRDDDYLAETSPVDGSTVRTRACSAGYESACTGSIPMAELVAEGMGDGKSTYTQWSGDSMSTSLIEDASFVVVGVGHSIGATNEFWSLDFSSATEASCN